MAAPTKESVLANIAAFVTAQGNQSGLGGLDQILKDILTLIPDEA